MRTNLKEKETLHFRTTQHWYFLLVPFLLTFLILLLSLYLYYKVGYPFLVFVIIVFISGVYLAYKYFERKCDIWVVTNLRLIDEEGVFTVRVKESPIDKINNVSYKQPPLGRLFGYGDVEIQTAAEMGATLYNGIANPKQLCDSITTAQENYKQNLFATQIQKINTAGAENNSSDTIECPHCAELIKAKAKICRNCGREIKA